MRSITTKLILLIMTAAVLPLLLFGFVSVSSLRDGTRESVREGNTNVATRAAEQISAYVANSVAVLHAIGAELNGTRLAAWQQDRVAKNFVLEFPEFREVSFFRPDGTVVATSRIGAPRLAPPPAGSARNVQVAPITIDDDLLPTTTIVVPLAPSADAPGGWIVGELRLEELWRMVDRIRVGRAGFLALLSSDGRLVAHGDPDEKRFIARGEILPEHDLAASLRAGREPYSSYTDLDGVAKLATGALVTPYNWAVIVEQEHNEAFRVTQRLERQLMIAILGALAITILVGTGWSRAFISRIFSLRRGTEALAAGRLDERVAIGGRDEIRQLADAFNAMADRLVELQENLRRQERQATFGRVAAGLVHDLSHPVQNIANSCKLLFHSWEDLEFRAVFRANVERETQAVKDVLEDLKSIARPVPLDRAPVDLNQQLAQVAEGMRASAEEGGITYSVALADGALPAIANDYALGRVYRNLIQNAIQATSPGGRITVSIERADGRAFVRVADTGSGIPPERLNTIFDDYFTTKRRGLGLGLAISRRLVEQFDGRITVVSELGQGTVFTVELPLAETPVPAGDTVART
ncbi:MAG TPA: sensor histidine kinase [Vicinamibacterales bacterium]|nr:sensor histidine kinase [Vicinamibacterales bacterium]